MASILAETFLSVVLVMSLLCNTLEGLSVADDTADLVPVWEPEPEPEPLLTQKERIWRPAEPAIFGTFRNCWSDRKCCSNVGPRICRSMSCCKEIVCGNEGCTRPKSIYCGCDPKTCVSPSPP